MCMCLHTHICIIYYQRKFSCRASELRTVSNDDNNSSFVAVVAVVGVVGVASSRQFRCRATNFKPWTVTLRGTLVTLQVPCLEEVSHEMRFSEIGADMLCFSLQTVDVSCVSLSRCIIVSVHCVLHPDATIVMEISCVLQSCWIVVFTVFLLCFHP